MEVQRYLEFSPGSPTGTALVNWWSELNSNRADRARLCRCSNLIEVVFVPAYHKLFHSLRPLAHVDEMRLPAVAGLIAHVRTEAGRMSFASQMALARNPGRGARLSGLRFRRLLRCKDQNESFPLLIRAIRLLDREANVCDLARGVYWWNDGIRKKWAYEYYSTAPTEK